MVESPEGRARNSSLDAAIVEACAREGMHWFQCFRLRLALRRCSDAEHLEIERQCTALLVQAGYQMPAGASVANGVLVGDWQSFIQMLIDSLPKILDFLMQLLPLIFSLL